MESALRNPETTQPTELERFLLDPHEDPIECGDARKAGCRFYRGDWFETEPNAEYRVTVRVLPSGTAYCFGEARNAITKARTYTVDWYLMCHNFKPCEALRLVADYSEVSV